MALPRTFTKSIDAVELANHVATQVGGKGGGRPDMARAGGSNPDKLDDALASVEDLYVKKQSNLEKSNWGDINPIIAMQSDGKKFNWLYTLRNLGHSVATLDHIERSLTKLFKPSSKATMWSRLYRWGKRLIVWFLWQRS